MILSIRHETRYTYPESVQLSPHRILLYPREHPQLRVLDFQLRIDPEARLHWMADAFENHIAVAWFGTLADSIRIDASIRVSLERRNPFDFIIEPCAERYPFTYDPRERRALGPSMEIGSPADCARVLPWIHEQFPRLPEKTLDVLTSLNRRIHETFTYHHREEPGIQSPDRTIELGSGSCRDFARLFIEGCRQLGFAARFASGYLHDPPAGPGHVGDVAKGSLHAWAEVYIPGVGWKGFDPANGILANAAFIPCAVAPEPELASPIQGTFTHPLPGLLSSMDVSLAIREEPPEAHAD